MKMSYRPLLSLGLACGLLLGASLAAAETAAEDKIGQRIQALLDGMKPDSVTQSPVSGLYEVLVQNNLFYVSADGDYLLQGDRQGNVNIIDLETRENLSKTRRNKINAELLAEVPTDEMIVFGKDDAKHKVTVFTDIDCGYCRKLHQDMDGYLEQGIQVRYLFFPRAGVGSESYNKSVSVWCSDDKQAAMTQAKSGESLPKRECENPVAEQKALGEQMGVSGTPALVLEDGELVPGYVPPERLAIFLEMKSQGIE